MNLVGAEFANVVSPYRDNFNFPEMVYFTLFQSNHPNSVCKANALIFFVFVQIKVIEMQVLLKNCQCLTQIKFTNCVHARSLLKDVSIFSHSYCPCIFHMQPAKLFFLIHSVKISENLSLSISKFITSVFLSRRCLRLALRS